MPYIAKSVFLTVSYLILMVEIADLKMFFLSLLIFVGGVLFDLYFSYTTLQNVGENWTVSITKFIIYVLAGIALFGLVVSVLGVCDILYVTKIEGTKYIIFRNNELKDVFGFMEFRFSTFLIILLVEIVSCLPAFLIHKIEAKVKNNKKDEQDKK